MSASSFPSLWLLHADDADATADAAAALKELAERLALTPEKTEAWLHQVRAMRGHLGP